MKVNQRIKSCQVSGIAFRSRFPSKDQRSTASTAGKEKKKRKTEKKVGADEIRWDERAPGPDNIEQRLISFPASERQKRQLPLLTACPPTESAKGRSRQFTGLRTRDPALLIQSRGTATIPPRLLFARRRTVNQRAALNYPARLHG